MLHVRADAEELLRSGEQISGPRSPGIILKYESAMLLSLLKFSVVVIKGRYGSIFHWGQSILQQSADFLLVSL